MTQPYICCYALSLGMLASAFGGEDDSAYIAEPEIIEEPGEPDAFTWLTPSIDLNTRYEYRQQNGLDASNAFNARARVGLLLGDFGGFSAFGEVEATAAIARDYQSNPLGTSATLPAVPGNTVIGDPQNAEINRFWLQYKKDGILAKVGRQRIIRNNAAFIGNVGWRQNEQTFDAAQIGYTIEDFSISYVYSNRVQRIFGATDPIGGLPLEEFEGDFHFVDATYDSSFGKLGAYAYLIDLDARSGLPLAAQGALSRVGQSNTYGAYASVGPLYAEFAFQDGSSTVGTDYTALYGHVKYTQKLGDKSSISAGVEYLQDDFKTPFATVHAFNGFADAFILDRIGLRNGPGGTYEGLSDAYLAYVKPGLPGGLTFKAFAHYYADDSFGDSYGYEIDAVLAKKFSDNLSGLVKAAYFVADNNSAYSDINQVTVDLKYTF